jgi:hypothetical protein
MEMLERRIGERPRIGLQLPPERGDRVDDRQAPQVALQRGERRFAQLALVERRKPPLRAFHVRRQRHRRVAADEPVVVEILGHVIPAVVELADLAFRAVDVIYAYRRLRVMLSVSSASSIWK